LLHSVHDASMSTPMEGCKVKIMPADTTVNVAMVDFDLWQRDDITCFSGRG
jgi:hypothetical protein